VMGNPFKPPGWRRRCNLKAVGRLYRKKFRWCKRCIYCGDAATGIDHVLPVSLAASRFGDGSTEDPSKRQYRRLLIKVPACADCNGLADNAFNWTLRSRIEMVRARRLRRERRAA